MYKIAEALGSASASPTRARKIAKGKPYGRILNRSIVAPNGKKLALHATKGWRCA